MQRQGALADAPLAGPDGQQMTHPGEPVGDADALLGDLLEDSGSAVARDVVIALHCQTGGLRPAGPPCTLARGDPKAPLRSRGSLAALVLLDRGASPRPTPLHARSRGPQGPAPLTWLTRCARSIRPGGFAPPDPPARSLAGTPRPHSAHVAHSLRSFYQTGGPRPAGPPTCSP